jgi:glycosyltransferase involved in cell wall biosynthesis
VTGLTRVVHIIQNLNYGGMERLLADIVGRLDRSRFEPRVLCLQYAGRFASEIEGVAPVGVAPRYSRLSMLRPTGLAAVIRSYAPHVVHTHSGVWYKASLAARMAGVPRVVHTEHGRARPDTLPHRLLDGTAARRTHVVVAVSEALAGELRDRLLVPAERVVVIHNGVDTQRFRPRADAGRIRAEIGLTAGSTVIGSIGRLEPVKGYDVVLRAFGALPLAWRQGRDAALVIAGDGSERGRLQALAQELRIDDRVFLLGWRDDAEDLLATFALFTMGSRSEGTSVSLLEAMSSGVCPVVTSVGGNAHVLGPPLGHRLVPPEDHAALARAWQMAVQDDASRSRDGQLSRRRVIDAFSIDAMVRAYERVYAGA